MRLATYLSASRHGIYYFRFPLPVDRHPARKRVHIKVSLATRAPKEAKQLARLLAVAGQTVLASPMIRTMRYDEIRKHVRDHFAHLLRAFHEQIAANGPVDRLRLDALRASQELAELDPAEWAATTHVDGAEGLLKAFCELRGISLEALGEKRALMMAEFQKGYREYISKVYAHTTSFDTLPLEHCFQEKPLAEMVRITEPTAMVDSLPIKEVLSRYFAELDRTKALAAKTKADKVDALNLMEEITEGKPPACMTKKDAQEIKAVLFKLPANRRKNPKTRNLPLRKMLEVPGVARIGVRTTNTYLGNLQTFFGWAVANGYAAENIFHGLRLKTSARTGQQGREAFSAEQLRLMFSHLTDPDSRLVIKDEHKWPTLIGMFTGMRLNEIAQLELADIEQIGEVWCINVTPDGEGMKRLKNSASKRRVPIHRRLMASGFMDFFLTQKACGHPRLFPNLTYTAQNGYGRTPGRWFNNRFLEALGLKDKGLVFHCLRHTMITRLAQAGVEEPLVKALVGHSQTGVTLGTYFKAGFLPDQLLGAINRFDF